MIAEPLTLCLLVSADDRPRPWTNSPDLTRRAAILELHADGTPRNITAGSCWHDERAAYADLAAEARTCLYNGTERHMTYWHLRFEPINGAELAEIEPVVRTLRAVTRRLDKLAERYGPPPTFGQYVARLADALHITAALRAVNTPPGSWTYTDAEYATMTPAEAGSWLDRQDNEWRAAHPNPERAA